ncbi:MAG: phosphoenolpyruvate carboxykinase [Planctomycetota bacterium]|nr:phosphoenolpyruvate carboxykinase [Planctomycetota bacterium]
MSRFPVEAKRFLCNLTPDEYRELIAEMKNARLTRFENYNVQTRVVARSKASTYLVTDHPEEHTDQCITREEGRRIAKMQDEYIQDQEMIVVEGYIGNDPEFRTPARMMIEKANANVAAMQQTLYFPVAESEKEGFEPEVTVIYTPNLPAPDYPNERLIAVDLESNVTRVLNSDYFGESKKGGLRMWNKIVYDRGGLSLHAGCKVIPVGDTKKVGLIVGLSGTGKTTTTFTRQNNSGPVQDDFIALMPGGKVYATENGCFAKTYGLDPKYEPTIHAAVIENTAYLENVSQGEDGVLDFFDTSYTKNGRAVFPMSAVEGYYDANEIDKASFLLILNRNENIIPAVARLDRTQGPAYFMLGETQGTSAGGAEEAGKSLRVPGTNPFFPLLHVMQGNRLLELLESSPLEVYLMNTGRVGGSEDESRSKKVKIPHSSAVVKGIAEGTISWEKDADFGYEVATSVPGIDPDDEDLLRPRLLYERQDRLAEYQKFVERLKSDRLAYMKGFPGLDESIIQAIR